MSVDQDAETPRVKWRVEPRPYHYGYENGYEDFPSSLRSIMDEIGVSHAVELSTWVWEHTGGNKKDTSGAVDLPPPLIEAFLWPALSSGEVMDVIEGIAQALDVSPGTLYDELWLRASRYSVDGKPDPDEDEEDAAE